jgi:para-aminobenzoate synthetase component I
MLLALQQNFIGQMNELGAKSIPFLFVIDFEGLHPMIYPLDKIPGNIRFQCPMFPQKAMPSNTFTKEVKFLKRPVSFERYVKAFSLVQKHLRRGDTYLLNLTLPSEIITNLSLEEIFERSTAVYKLWIQDSFLCFSPEIFVRIREGEIASYPMKGTIDAALPNAEQMLLDDPKELAEHNTIVDLIRNDLSMVAKKVSVRRYRYIERLKTHESELLQASSEIVGQLPDDYARNIGTILSTLLPAGSISGAPKEKTLAVIKAAERYPRGFYTGVFGVFDGRNMDSGVMIRFIEKQGAQLFYKSGGGITAQSDLKKEYQELIDKVYVPFT